MYSIRRHVRFLFPWTSISLRRQVLPLMSPLEATICAFFNYTDNETVMPHMQSFLKLDPSLTFQGAFLSDPVVGRETQKPLIRCKN